MNNKRASIVWPLVVCAGQVFSGIRAKRNYFSLEEILPVLEIQRVYHEELPGVSIIVPARNEVTHLPYLLESLLCQDYPRYEIIVVDDASTDGTATLVQSYSKKGVRLIATDGPPQGWTGKNHACWIGIIPLACRGEELVSVRMYTNLQQIANDFGKNSYPYLQQSPYSGMQTAGSTALAASVATLFVDAYRKKSRLVFSIAILAYIVQVVSILSWLKHFRVNRVYALLAPFSAFVFLLIALNSLLHTVTGRSVAWKGRRYENTPAAISSLLLAAHRMFL